MDPDCGEEKSLIKCDVVWIIKYSLEYWSYSASLMKTKKKARERVSERESEREREREREGRTKKIISRTSQSVKCEIAPQLKQGCIERTG